MLRRLPVLLALAGMGWGAAGAFAPPAFAEDPAPPAAPALPAPPAPPAAKFASDADAEAAVAKFREDWKAPGLKGDDKLMQRDFALAQLSRVAHPLVVLELGEAARTADDDLRPIAVAYLGLQKGSPALSGEQILAAMKKHAKDDVLVISGVQALGQLRYLGADDQLKALLKTEDYALKKAVIIAVGQLGDMRLMDELLKLLGVDPNEKAPDGGKDDPKSGGKEVVDEGYSYEGAEATVDTGTAGDGDQKAAEAKVKDQIARNKAAAGGGKGGGGGGGAGSGVGGTGGRGGSARSKEELKPYILKALKALTGETFMSSKELRVWLSKSGPQIAAKKKTSAELEAEQKAALKK